MTEVKDATAAGGGENESKKIVINIGGTDIEARIDDNGRIVMPKEVESIMAVGMATLNKANQQIEDGNGDAGKTVGDKSGKDGVEENFKGIPMRELIGAPLFAAAEAQEKLASIAWDYYKKIGYEEDGKTTRLLKFEVNRPIVEDGHVKEGNNKQQVEAPFIGLVPIPSLLINRIDVDFQMEVTDTNSSTDRSSADASTDISSKWFGVSVGISGKVSSSHENTRTTNQTGKYQVHVTATQQPQTEGLSKLMDIMASCIEPIPVESSSK